MFGSSPNHHSLKPTTTKVKFLCSYRGKILPRQHDGKLRYHGGETRILAVDRSISFSELLVKLRELCGTSVSLRCQLPTEDLDALVSVTCDEDLTNLIEEYDRFASATTSSSLKIRAFLSAPKPTKKISPPSYIIASCTSSNPYSVYGRVSSSSANSRIPFPVRGGCIHHHQNHKPVVVGFPICYEKSAGKFLQYCAYHGHGNISHVYPIQNGNPWQ